MQPSADRESADAYRACRDAGFTIGQTVPSGSGAGNTDQRRPYRG